MIVFSPFLSFIAQSTSFDVDTSLPYYTSFGLDYRVPSLHRGYVYAVARQRGSTELVRAVGADRVRPTRSRLLDKGLNLTLEAEIWALRRGSGPLS